jgi:hypothetical protein
MTDVSLANVMGLYAIVRSPLRHHIGTLADIGDVVQESLPSMAAFDRATPSIQDIQPAIAVQAARLSAKARRAAPVLPSSAPEQPLRLVSSWPVSWRPAFWWPEAAVERA